MMISSRINKRAPADAGGLEWLDRTTLIRAVKTTPHLAVST